MAVKREIPLEIAEPVPVPAEPAAPPPGADELAECVSPASIVFDEAENRMHTIKAVMVATLGS